MTGWLIDKSALWKLPQSPEFGTWVERINRGLVSASLPTRLEVAVSARNQDDWRKMQKTLLAPLLDAYATPSSEAVALDIEDSLVGAGVHRSVSLPDVMVASIAIVGRLTVLHDDKDFEVIRREHGTLTEERLVL